MGDTREKVALVTGASSGFGLYASVELARRGVRVFASMRDLSRAGPLLEAATAEGVHLDTVALDVTVKESIHAALEEIRSRAGGVDILVNNAGIGLGGCFEDTSEEELRQVMETNFFGVTATTRAVLPEMRQRRFGRIINVSSMNGRVGAPAFSAYAASKFAVEGFSESLRGEVVGFGIHVVLVEPGMFRTDIFGRNRHVARAAHDPASPYAGFTRKLESQVDGLVERFAGDPRVVARVIADAATARSPRMRYVVGKDARAAMVAHAVLPSFATDWIYGRTVPTGGESGENR